MKAPSFKVSSSLFSSKHWNYSQLFWFIGLSVVWLGTLGLRHLLPSDEGRYAEIAREMLIRGDFIVPRYNDYLYFEKPPLQMWGTALVFKLFGLGEWQARLWSGLTSLLTILMVWYTSFRLWGMRSGTVTAIILASSPLWIIGGHFNSLDMGVAFFMTGALCTLLLALHAIPKSPSERKWMMLCWLMMALSVLSKGLIGIVLPGLVLVVYSLSSWDWGSWKRMYWITGLLLFLVVSTPWFILITERHPSFFHFFFIHEHFERFASNEHQRTAPWYFFVPLVAVGFLPWLFQLPHAIQTTFTERNNQTFTFKPLWLCLIWTLSITVFFSMSESKLPGYIFPVIPSLSIITGVSLTQLFEKKRLLNASGAKIWEIQLILIGVLFFTGLFFVKNIRTTGEPYEASYYAQYSQFVLAALMIGLLGCALAWWYRRDMIASTLIYSSALILLSLTAGMGHETVGRLLSGYDVASKAKAVIRPEDPLYGVGILDHTIPFYLEHPLIMVHFQDELAFGISQEPDRWIPTEDEWIKLWQQNPTQKAFALMTPDKYAAMIKKNVPMEVVAEDPLRFIVGKPGLNQK
jgi:4-amino-4-deoxy-L-arabinose transferase-like glycosyltransferase